MSMTTSEAWFALENLVDLERQRDEAKAECDRLNSRIGEEYNRITEAANCPIPDITATLSMIRAIGSPLDIANPREPAAGGPANGGDPLDIPPHLDRRAPSAEAAE